MMKKNSKFYISSVLALTIAGCAASHVSSTRNPATDGSFSQLKGTYDKLYPLYAIECASSQFDQIGQPAGGPYGHTFMYLKGACRDKSVNYPKIKVCDPGTDLTNPESGVGLALDKNYSNTRYVATDGFNFLINGDLSANAPLDTAAFEAAVQKMVADGDAKGVILNASATAAKTKSAAYKANPNMSNEEWVAREVIGSTYAVDFARNLGCVTVPINAAMLEAAVNEVNTQNAPFISGKKKFVWNAVSDQCVQFTHNVFAGMGIGKHIATSDNKILMVWDVITQLIPFVPTQMPAPVNDLIAADARTNGAKIFSLDQAYHDKTIRNNFRKFNRLPATDGVLMWTQAAHSDQNEYFNTQAQLKAVDLPIVAPNQREYRRLTELPSATEISGNLTAYLSKLQETIEAMNIEGHDIDDANYCDFAAAQKGGSNSSAYKSFCQQYVAYLHDSKTAVEGRLTALNNL